MTKALAQWLDQRFPMAQARNFLRSQGDKLLPAHTSWWHTFGSLLLFLTLNQIVTGILLMVYYRPTSEAAFESVRFITTRAHFGWLIRGLHAWGANVMILLLVAHMLRTFLMGTYKKPRELTWVIGVLIFGTVLIFGFTGYLLPWNQVSYWATVVGTEITGAMPVVGEALKGLVRGGDAVGTETLGRFYVAHVAVLPWVLTGTVMVHLLLVRLLGIAPLTRVGQEQLDTRGGVRFYPQHVAKEAAVFVVFLAALVALVFFDSPGLGDKANPIKTPEGIKPEWYFLPTYQLLKLVPRLPGILLSFLPMLLLLLWPFLDRTPERHPKKRKWAMALGALAVAVPLFLGVLGYVSERTFIVSGARIHFDIYGRPQVAEVLPPDRRPVVALAPAVEEGKKMIVATVTRGGRPLEGVTVALAARSEVEARVVQLGHDVTLDDGTAAVPMPEKLGGDTQGEIGVLATITAPEAFAGYKGEATISGAAPTPHEMWTHACPESALVVGSVLLVGLLSAIVFRRLTRQPVASKTVADEGSTS